MIVGLVFLTILVTSLGSIFYLGAAPKPKRLTGAALQAYIRELEIDCEIIPRPPGFSETLERVMKQIREAKTRQDLDLAYYEMGRLPPPAEWPRDPLGRFDNNGKRIRVGTQDLGPR